MARGPVIVTRPAEAGARLTQRLRAAGWDARHWPAFDLLPARDPQHARARLAQTAPGDLLVFVSPAAVRACAELLPRWPSGVRAAAVGAGTARAFHAAYGAAVDCLSPDDAAGEGGSEALYARLAAAPWPRRVLILRADQGREWLAERLQAAGVTVETLSVYRREPLQLDPNARSELARAIAAGHPPTLLVSSSEAIAALRDAVASVPGAWDWLRGGRALAIHARIAAALRDAGFAAVSLVHADDEAVLAKLESEASD
jgi:uroporphyrinogen-III synthase